MAIELVARYSTYERGKAYAARITGLSDRYGLEREFLPAVEKRSSRSGATGWKTYFADEPGVYEVSSTGRKGPEREYYLVELADGELRPKKISLEQAREIVR